MAVNMVRWPVNDRRWESTGEGGLYAFLVIPISEDNEASRMQGGACVCTYTYITRPDVVVSDNEAKVWPPRPDDSTDHVWEARRILDAGGHEKESLALGNTIGYDELSDVVQASVFLGSTDQSLVRVGEPGRYFTVTPEDLDAHGTALYCALKEAYRTEPLLVTFLDT